MERVSFYGMLEGFAKAALSRQEKRDGDYTNENGLLVCGTCGELRQRWLDPANTKAEGFVKTEGSVLVTASCKCDRERQAEEERLKKAQEDMEAIQRLRKMSLMDEKFVSSKFESFQTNKFNEKNLKLCKRYADAFDKMVEKNQGLLMWGNVGTGKSFAAACIANQLLSQKTPVVMTSLVKLLEAIQPNPESETEIIAKLNRAKLVIFDDLGAERSTDYALEKVYNIIDSRYRKNLPMILTTNLTLEEMQQESDMRYRRIYDRIFEVCYPMQFTGPSWRQKAAFERFNDMEKMFEDDA